MPSNVFALAGGGGGGAPLARAPGAGNGRDGGGFAGRVWGFRARPSNTSRSDPPLLSAMAWASSRGAAIRAASSLKFCRMYAAARSRCSGIPSVCANALSSASRSAVEVYRSSASFARARNTIRSRSTGTDDTIVEGGGTSALRIFSITTISLSPSKSLRIVRNSHRQIPTEKTSERRSTGRPRTCSGDMYPNFPLIAPTCVRASLPAAFAIPKSMSFASPSYDTSTFCGLTSRWTSPIGFPWASLR